MVIEVKRILCSTVSWLFNNTIGHF